MTGRTRAGLAAACLVALGGCDPLDLGDARPLPGADGSTPSQSRTPSGGSDQDRPASPDAPIASDGQGGPAEPPSSPDAGVGSVADADAPPDLLDAGIASPADAAVVDSAPAPADAGTAGLEAGPTLPAPGFVGAAPTVLGSPVASALVGDVLYVADWGRPEPMLNRWTGNVQAYDISDPTRPRRLSEFQTCCDEVGDLAVSADRLFVANDALGLHVFDLAVPSHPASTAMRLDGSYAHSLSLATLPTAQGSRLHAFVGHIYNGALAIYDVTEATGSLPPPVSYRSPDPAARDVNDVQVEGTHAFLLVGDGGADFRLEVLHLGLPSLAPARIGSLPLPAYVYGGLGELRVSGSIVYYSSSDSYRDGMLAASGGLRVIDVSDPLTPRLVGSLDLPEMGFLSYKGAGLDVARGRAFVVGSTALHVLDVSSPDRPVKLTSFALPPEFVNCDGGRVVVRDNLAFVTAGSTDDPNSRGGIAVFNVALP